MNHQILGWNGAKKETRQSGAKKETRQDRSQVRFFLGVIGPRFIQTRAPSSPRCHPYISLVKHINQGKKNTAQVLVSCSIFSQPNDIT